MERLFDAPEEPPDARRAVGAAADGPLAARMRPRTLADFVGQEHLLGEGSALRTALESGDAALDGPVRPARHGQDDARAARGRARRRRLRGALGGQRGPRRGARGDRARPPAARRRPPHDLLPRRDPPLQQGPAGRAAARGRGRARDADRRHDREPVLRGQQRAALAHAGLRAAARSTAEQVEGLLRRALEAGECGGARSADDVLDVPGRALGRRRAHRAERARARVRDRRRATGAAGRRWPTPRTRCSARPSSTTRAATSTTTTSRPGSSPRAGRTPTPRSTTSRRCSRAARTRASSCAGWSSSPPRTSATPTRRRCRSRSPRRRAVEHVGLPEATYALAQAAIYLSLAPKSNAAGARARRRARPHPRARRGSSRPAPLRSAAYPAAAQARPRARLRLPARPPGPGQRPGAPARRASRTCASTTRATWSRSCASACEQVRRARGRRAVSASHDPA